MTPTRRSLITGIGALLCAPAIVRASSIMPVKAWSDQWVRANSPMVRVVGTISSGGNVVFHYPTRERFSIGDLVYIGEDGYAYRHDSSRCPAPTESWRNPCVGAAV